jgi:ABC-2 type transport system permease protein
VIGALLLIYVYNFRAIPVEAISEIAPLVKEIIVLLNVVLSGLVLTAVAARFLYTGVSMEGQAFWVIRTSPVEMKRFLMSKFMAGFLPVSLITLGIVLVTDLMMGVRGLLMAVSLCVVFMLSASISGLGAGMGAMFPKFRYENMASVSMSLGGMAFMVVAFSVVLATAAVLAWPFYIFYKTGSLGWGAALASAGFALGINLTALVVPMRMGVRALKRLNRCG